MATHIVKTLPSALVIWEPMQPATIGPTIEAAHQAQVCCTENFQLINSILMKFNLPHFSL